VYNIQIKMLNNNKYIILIGIVVLVLGLLIVLVVTKKNVDENYGPLSQPGFGPNNPGFGYMPPYRPPENLSVKQDDINVNDLLKWWFDYTSKMPTDVIDYIYEFCPFLETVEAINHYGLTQNNIDLLKFLKQHLKNVKPEDIKNVDDVNKHFNICVTMLNNAAGVINYVKSGMYDEPIPNIPGVVDVF